jgi:hypothetical protein
MPRPLFYALRRTVQFVLVCSLLLASGAGLEEWSLRKYLRGFSDAVVPLTASPEQKVEAILAWMRAGPARRPNTPDDFMSNRNPEDTLNYGQLLKVCGTATNAFMNLAISSGLQTRRLLLLDPDHHVKHVVAEVRLGDHWAVVDPSFRVLFRDSSGRPMTRRQLEDPARLREATRDVPSYPAGFSYEETAHVHLSRFPVLGTLAGRSLNRVFPAWEVSVNWTLPLERRPLGLSFLALFLAGACLLIGGSLNWYAKRRLRTEKLGARERLRRLSKAL